MHHPLSRRTLLALLAGAPSRPGARRRVSCGWTERPTNPVSLVLRQQALLKAEFAHDGTAVRWVQSAGSNKAQEFLNAVSLDFGSTAGAAALIGRAGSNPIQSFYVFSHPEWTALVTRGNSPVQTVADLRGQPIAVTRGTDPHVFLVRALAEAGMSERRWPATACRPQRLFRPVRSSPPQAHPGT